MSPLTATNNVTNNSNRQGSIASIRSISSYKQPNNRGWSATCLRPAPPLRLCLALGPMPNGSPLRSNRKPTTYKEDALILEVIEAYCSAIKPRNTINSGECHFHILLFYSLFIHSILSLSLFFYIFYLELPDIFF